MKPERKWILLFFVSATTLLFTLASGATAHGNGWIGLTRREAFRVTSVAQASLLPPWAALLLMIGALLLAWRREGT